MMKIICQDRKWPLPPKPTAKTLLETCFTNGLIPQHLHSHYNSLRAVLESDVPTIRNNLGGHGQGSTAASVPDYMARQRLHLCAANILFLMMQMQN